MIGIDLLSVTDLTRLLDRAWFRSYAYTEVELSAALRLGPTRSAEFLAGRFAAKEAVAKALGSGFAGGVRPCQIEIPPGAPRVRLSSVAAHRAEEACLEGIAVSITHKADLVVAVAFAVSGDSC